MKQHTCEKENIKWNTNPSSDCFGESIAWNGKCEVCGKKVYELYIQEPELYDLETGEEI